MRPFNYSLLSRRLWSHDMLRTVGALCREAGKEELYIRLRPRELSKLTGIARVKSIRFSNAIEGITAPDARIREIADRETDPQGYYEQQIAGYRDALDAILENFGSISVTSDNILRLHRILYGHTNCPWAGKIKTRQNYISAVYPDGHQKTLFTPTSPSETPDALDSLCSEYSRVTGNGEIDPLIAIPVFIRDFLCIHPFSDGNGRMSRLLTTLLLCRSGFLVGRYISLEEKIGRWPDLYYSALSASEHEWHDGKEDPEPFIRYLLGTVLAAYKDFEERFSLVETRQTAIEKVRLAAHNKIGRFAKQDIRELCPYLSESSIEGALRKLVSSGELVREGIGRSTCYRRLDSLKS